MRLRSYADSSCHQRFHHAEVIVLGGYLKISKELLRFADALEAVEQRLRGEVFGEIEFHFLGFCAFDKTQGLGAHEGDFQGRLEGMVEVADFGCQIEQAPRFPVSFNWK